tara:strand:+ start:1588 stop:2091 length:504 start_codon:yes stop_codon:yes gene_type:complete
MRTNLLPSIAAVLIVSVSACGSQPEVVDTTLTDDETQSTVADVEVEGQEVEPELSDTLPQLSNAWLVGTWGPAEANPTNDPGGSCETDVIIRFARDGTYEDGSSSGRYRVKGNHIVYFERQTVPDIAADPEELFYPEPVDDWTGVARVVDDNTFDEEGELWRRCKSY